MGQVVRGEHEAGGAQPSRMVQTMVENRVIREHERARDVRVFQPEDPDEWYEQATGKELGSCDPGPLFHLPAGRD